MKVTINIFPKADVLNPEAEAIEKSLQNLDFENFRNLSLGKKVIFFTNDKDNKQVYENAQEMCKKLLVNPVIEDYEIIVENES